MGLAGLITDKNDVRPPPKKPGPKKPHAANFKPGVSGNPGGRPKAIVEVVNLAREQTEAAIRTLAEIAVNADAHPGARVAAACAILDRGWGKPRQDVHVDQTVNLRVQHLEALKVINDVVEEHQGKTPIRKGTDKRLLTAKAKK